MMMEYYVRDAIIYCEGIAMLFENYSFVGGNFQNKAKVWLR